MRLALMGISGSGKDYLTNHLKSKYNFVRFSFSDQLKRLAHTIYPWMTLDYPPIDKEAPLNITLETGEIINKSPREIWLHLNMLRDIENKIFIRMLQEQIFDFTNRPTPHKFLSDNIVVTDVRTNEEFLWCKENSFSIIYIKPSKKIYKNYDFDKEIEINSNNTNLHFTNQFDGSSSFDEFYRTRIAL